MFALQQLRVPLFRAVKHTDETRPVPGDHDQGKHKRQERCLGSVEQKREDREQHNDHDGSQGEIVRREPVPEEYRRQYQDARRFLLEALSMYSDELLEMLLGDRDVPEELIHRVVKSATLSRQLTPVFLASAYRCGQL